MNIKIRRQLTARKKRLERHIDKSNLEGCEQPMLRPGNIRYELAERTQGLAYGGIGTMRVLVQELGLAEAIDKRLHLLKIHLPYHESDHVLNLAYNALCDGDCLEDLELRRTDTWSASAFPPKRPRASPTSMRPAGTRTSPSCSAAELRSLRPKNSPGTRISR